jgi:PAS domain S-box-containing protein
MDRHGASRGPGVGADGARGRFEVIYRLRRADNTIITVQEIGQAVPGSDGRGARVLGAIRDITARVRAEEEVRESAHKYRMLFDGAHDAIFLLRDLSVVDCSAHAEVLFGAPTASLLGRSIEAFSPPFQPDGQPTGVRLAPLARAALGGEPQFFEWRHVRADGTEFDAEVSLKAIVLAGVHHLQAIVRDITDRKRAAESAKTILLQKETLLREAHHRIKNNLATVASLLSLQADRVQDPGSCGTLRDACNRVRTMSAIYEKLFSSQSYTVVDLRPYLSGLIEALARAYVVHRDRVVLSSAIEEGVVPVRSAFPLGLIVNEIVTNALKHAFPEDRSGRVDVSVRAVADGKLEVVIADDGIGLPARARERQAPGFGLDLVEVMVAQIEGTLSVENRSGTRYTITFVP